MVDPSEYGDFSTEDREYLDPYEAMEMMRAATQTPPQRKQPTRLPLQGGTDLGAIDSRLQLASYYRALLEQSLFDSVDDFSSLVEKEVRDFIVSRLKALVGTAGQPKPVEVKQFSDQEAVALRTFAKALLARQANPIPQMSPPQSVPQPQQFPQEPQVRTVEAPQRGPKLKKAKTPKKQDSSKVLGRNPLTAPSVSTWVEKQEVVQPLPRLSGAALEAMSANRAAADAMATANRPGSFESHADHQ
jgi:hypothetical protein